MKQMSQTSTKFGSQTDFERISVMTGSNKSILIKKKKNAIPTSSKKT
jgi:hypothetical protein